MKSQRERIPSTQHKLSSSVKAMKCMKKRFNKLISNLKTTRLTFFYFTVLLLLLLLFCCRAEASFINLLVCFFQDDRLLCHSADMQTKAIGSDQCSSSQADQQEAPPPDHSLRHHKGAQGAQIMRGSLSRATLIRNRQSLLPFVCVWHAEVWASLVRSLHA